MLLTSVVDLNLMLLTDDVTGQVKVKMFDG